MSGLTRSLALGVALALLAAIPASATPPDQVVVVDEHVVRERLSEIDFFPCLGEAGMQDDEAQITGVETRRTRVTAAGVDADGQFIPPFHVFASFHARVTIDPLAPDLPAYAGSEHSVFVEQLAGGRDHVVATALFRAAALDGSGSITFRFRRVLAVDPHGVVRVERTTVGCETS